MKDINRIVKDNADRFRLFEGLNLRRMEVVSEVLSNELERHSADVRIINLAARIVDAVNRLDK